MSLKFPTFIALSTIFLASIIAQPKTDLPPPLVESAICGRSSLTLPIGNGTYPAMPGDFPWLVRLAIKGLPMCTAAVVNREWIISAARCFYHNT